MMAFDLVIATLTYLVVSGAARIKAHELREKSKEDLSKQVRNPDSFYKVH